jgi:hypothetical protein
MPPTVASAPDYLTLKRNRDEAGRHEPRFRRIGIAFVSIVLLLGLLNLFGQRPSTSYALAPQARLKVYAPAHLRGGLIYEVRFTINAHRELKDARLVLGTGWAEGITINQIEPAPIGQASDNGRIALDLGHIQAGKKYILYVQASVNPTNVGRRPQTVELDDGPTRIARLTRMVTIFP